MTVSFAGVAMPYASKVGYKRIIAIRDGLLQTGDHMIQSNAITGFEPKYACLCTWAQVEALEATIGSSGTLITDEEPSGYSNCYIASFDVQESDALGYYTVTMGFKRDTR